MASVRAVGAVLSALVLGACGIGGGGPNDATVFPLEPGPDAGLPDAAEPADSGSPIGASDAGPSTAADGGAANSFCWINEPQGARLAAVWGITASDAWAVGSPSLALHYDGQRWTRTQTPGIQRFVSVWASGSQDIWLLGSDGAVLRGNRAGFSTSLAAGVSSWRMWVRGAGGDDVWAGLYHWDGATWTKTAGPKSWGDDSESMLAWPLGDGTAYGIYWQPFSEGFSECARWDGASWRSDPCPGDQPEALWASSPDDLWMTGYPAGHWDSMGGYVQSGLQWRSHFDGAQWRTETFARGPEQRPLISGTGPTDVWFASPSAHYDGTAVSPVSPPDDLTLGLSAVPGKKVFALSWEGKVALGDGKSWETLLDVEPDLWATGEVAGERIGVDAERIVRLESGRWATLARATAPFSGADRLLGNALDDLWVVRYGDTAAYHWDGARWSAFANPIPTGRFWGEGSAARGKAWFVSEEPAVIEGVSTQRFRLLVKEPGSATEVVGALGDDQVWAVQAFASGETLVFATRMLGPGFANFIRVLWRHDGTGWTEVWSDSPNGESGGWRPIPGVRAPKDVWLYGGAPSPGDGYWWRELRHWDGTRMRSVGAVRGDQGEVTAVVGPGEVWISTHDRDGFRRATLAGIEPGTFVQFPASARDLWRLPGRRIQALSDGAAVWELRPSCAPIQPSACTFSYEPIDAPAGLAALAARGLNEQDSVLMNGLRNDDHQREEPYLRRADGSLVRIDLPEGVRSRSAYSFNDLEQVVGADLLPGGRRAFVWTSGTTYPLGAPDLSALTASPGCPAATPGHVHCQASAINNRGIAVGHCYPGCASGQFAVRWQDSVPTLLATFEATAEGINESGVVWGGSVLWRDGGLERVTSPDGASAVAHVNESGQMVVATIPSQHPMAAYGFCTDEIRVSGGTPRRLQPLPGLPGTSVGGLNNLGVAVGASWKRSGWAEDERYDARAVYWLDEQPIEITPLLEGATPPLLMEAWLVNDRGRIVARSEDGPDGRFWLLTPHGDCFAR